MLSLVEENQLHKMMIDWECFKNKRKKGKYEEVPDKGWLTMLKREDMLDKAMYYIKREMLENG